MQRGVHSNSCNQDGARRHTVTCSRDGEAVFWQGNVPVHELQLQNASPVKCKENNRSRINCTLQHRDCMLFGVASGIFTYKLSNIQRLHPAPHLQPAFSQLGKNDWVYSMLAPSQLTAKEQLLAVTGCEVQVLRLGSGVWKRHSFLLRENRAVGLRTGRD